MPISRSHLVRDLPPASALPGPVDLCGRLVAALPGGQMILRDASGEVRLLVEVAASGEAHPGAPVGLGDWVHARGTWAGSSLRASHLEVLTAYHGRLPYARLPDAESRRLAAGPRPRLAGLQARHTALRAARSFFDARGFLEVETPIAVPSPGVEVHLDAMALSSGQRFLTTSPEYQMKRLLAGGCERIFQMTRAFRQGEVGRHHNPEFSLLEWYRAFEQVEAIVGDVEQLCAKVALALHGSTVIDTPSGPIDLTPPWERLTVRQAMQRHAAVALRGDEPVGELRRLLGAAGHRLPPGDLSFDELFFLVFLDAVEPHLGRSRPTLLLEWPLPLASLARPCPADPAVVERFEAYAAGLELCNGFGELTDAVEQRRRCQADLAERRRRGKPELPFDERFLAALEEGMPPCAGVALGFDRLLMLCTGATSIREVLAFADDEL